MIAEDIEKCLKKVLTILASIGYNCAPLIEAVANVGCLGQGQNKKKKEVDGGFLISYNHRPPHALTR